MSAPVRLPAEDRRRQILSVAEKLFARRGFRGTTTRQIAQQAGVNEAILFRHFSTKEALYWAILDDWCHRTRRIEELKARLAAPADDAEILTGLAEATLRRNLESPSLSRLLLFSALENHRLAGRFFRTHVADYYLALARFIRERIDAGKFRRVDPLVAARGFLGMVVYHFLIQDIFGARRYQKFDSREVCRTLAGIWLRGMRKEASARRAPRAHRDAAAHSQVTARRAAHP